MTDALDHHLVNSLRDALVVRRLRNQCRAFFTRHRDPIGWWRQVRWYYRQYRPGLARGGYRLYLFRDRRGGAVGYGGLALREGRLYVTECLAEEHRGRGLGREVLRVLETIGREERRPLVAEIWADNLPSVALHERAGFVLESAIEHEGRELRTYSR